VVLVDGRNTVFRVAWTHRELTHNDEPVGVLYGFMRTLVSVWRRWPDSHVVIAWESRSKRRLEESQKALDDGVITAEQGVYKANRVHDDHDEVYASVMAQEETLKELLSYTLAQQLRVEGFEADDVIGTVATSCERDGDDVIVFSSDHDFYQLISERVSVFHPTQGELWDLTTFQEEHGIKPHQWVEVGALAGDGGDNIHGVPGVGIKTALKFIKEHGDLQRLLDGLETKEKRSKTEQKIIDNRLVVRLAFSLKRIDCDVSGLPVIQSNVPNALVLRKRFEDLGFKSLRSDVSLLSRRARDVLQFTATSTERTVPSVVRSAVS
jgi:DNA polymerase-1